jgi:glutaredoxin-related protein
MATKETELEFKNKNVKQHIKDLVLTTVMTDKNEEYESKTNLKIFLKEGDKLLFDEVRGYYLPAIPVDSIEYVIANYNAML